MQKLPTTLYTTSQVRELDQIVIKDFGIPGIELMSRAGNAVFRELMIRWPDTKVIEVFCGVGNNGGDGYIIAGMAQFFGMKVTVYSLVNPNELTNNARIAYQDYVSAKGVVLPFNPTQKIESELIVDAMLGTGLNKPVSGIYAQAIQVINSSGIPVIAVDVPSGLNADTGVVMGCALKANCTVTFIGLKQGLFTGFAAEYCGDIDYSSLGVPEDIFNKVVSQTYRVSKLAITRRNRCGHKGNYGHVLIIGGNCGFSGAVRMAGEAALRVGAGLVSISTQPSHAAFMNVGRPELMCHGVEISGQLSPLLEKATVVVIGPGLGQTKWAAELFIAAMKSGKTLIVDADGLNLLAHTPEKHHAWILTPHPGEAARLLGCSSAIVQQDRFAAVSAIQAKYEGIAVLKGAGTLIASTDEIAISSTGNPGMASGGMGDVLSGVIGGLIAQGFSLTEAAQQGVFLHGMAGDLAAEQIGERGLLANDLMPYLTKLVN